MGQKSVRIAIAGIVIDAVRCAALTRERGVGGAPVGPPAWLMKSPPEQFTDEEAHRRTLTFVAGEGR